MAFALVEPDGDPAGEDVHELLARVGVRAVGGRPGCQDEELGLEQRWLHRQLLDAHAAAGVDRRVAAAADHPARRGWILRRPVVARPDERGDRDLEDGRQADQGGHRRARRASLQAGHEGWREAGPGGDAAEGEAGRGTQCAEPLPDRARVRAAGSGGRGDVALPGMGRPALGPESELPPDGRRVEPLHRPQPADPPQLLHLGGPVAPFAAAGTARGHQPLALPEPEGAGGDPDLAGGIRDPEVPRQRAVRAHRRLHAAAVRRPDRGAAGSCSGPPRRPR